MQRRHGRDGLAVNAQVLYWQVTHGRHVREFFSTHARHRQTHKPLDGHTSGDTSVGLRKTGAACRR